MVLALSGVVRGEMSFVQDHVRKSLANHTIIQVSKAPMESWWLTRTSGEYTYSSLIVFSQVGTIITGDLRATDANAIAALGYNRDWFIGTMDESYLCSKFLKTEWRPDLAAKYGRQRVLESRRKLEIKKEQALTLWEACEEVEESEISPGDFGEAYLEVFGDYPEGGSGYHPSAANWLCAIQERFSALYKEQHPA